MAFLQTLYDNFLSCSICTGIYKDPCTIGCSHTFCRECLGKYTKTRRDAITARSILCPTCCQMTTVPDPSNPVEEWTNQFKPSFLIQGLMDTFVSPGRAESTERACFPCQQAGETTAASSICNDCDVILCDRCVRKHTASSDMSSHVMSSLTGEGEIRKRNVMCKEHNGLVEFFCRDCRKAVCQKCCVVYDDKCHTVVTLDSMMSEMKNVLLQTSSKINVHLQDMKKNLTVEQKEMEEIIQIKSSVQSEIKSVSQQAMELIKQKEKQLMDEVDEITEKQTGQLRTQMKSTEIDLQMCQQFCEFIDRVVRSESKMVMHGMYQMCQSGAIAGDMKKNTGNISSISKLALIKDLNISQLNKDIHLGHVSLTEKGLDLSCKPRLHQTVEIKTENGECRPDPCDIVVLDIDDGETLVVTDYRNSSLKSYCGSQSQFRSLNLMSKPFCVTKLSNNTVAASFCSPNKFVIVQVSPDFVLQSVVTTRKNYKCLTATSSSSLAAGCRNPPGIDILDLSGKVLRSLGAPSGQNLIQDPWYLSVTNKGHILVSFMSESVYCLTPEGHDVFQYNLSGDGGPRGIATTVTQDESDVKVFDLVSQ